MKDDRSIDESHRALSSVWHLSYKTPLCHCLLIHMLFCFNSCFLSGQQQVLLIPNRWHLPHFISWRKRERERYPAEVTSHVIAYLIFIQFILISSIILSFKICLDYYKLFPSLSSMQVFQNDLSSRVKLCAPFTLISTHLACLHTERCGLFSPTAVITHNFLPITHLPPASIFHAIIFIKIRSKMLLGFLNIARLPSICMLFSLHNCAALFVFPWLR